MKNLFRFAKTAAVVLAMATMAVSCQKDEYVSGDSLQTDNGKVNLKIARTVTDDTRNWGTSADWMGGTLSYLVEGKNLPSRHPEFFENVPSGIEVLKESFVYLTFVTEVAKFNNVVGYYTYSKDDLIGDLEADRAFILQQIFTSGTQGVDLKQVVYTTTKGLEFGTTYELSNDGAKFKAGTIIGFYLLPNGSNGNSPIVWDRDGKPQFIATDANVNITSELPDGGKVSHIMGRTLCDDLIIAFEDLNSLYSKKSDEDYNDLVFVVGDNLDSRRAENIRSYNSNSSEPADLWLVGDYCQTDEPCVKTQVVDLIAGQHYTAGNVTVTNDDSYLYVTYNTTTGWKLGITHLYVGEGKPQKMAPGQLEGQGVSVVSVTTNFGISATYKYNLSDLPGCFYIAAHAEVNSNQYGGQTAWGKGDKTGDNWSMIFNYCKAECLFK